MATSDADVFKTILDKVEVLLVCDSPESCEAIEQLLAIHGAKVASVRVASDVPGALDARRVDIIVDDSSDPSIVDCVRECDSGADRPIPVIALTQDETDEAREALAKAGFHAVLCKPFGPEKLVTLVAASLGRC